MKYSIERRKINDKLREIFINRFNIDFLDYGEKFFTLELLGKDIGMQPRDLIYLFFDIEKEFGVEIRQEAIAEGKFNNLNNIAELIGNY